MIKKGRQETLRQDLDDGYDAGTDKLFGYGKGDRGARGDRTTDLSKSAEFTSMVCLIS